VVLPKTGGFSAVIWGSSVDATPVLLTASGMQNGKAEPYGIKQSASSVEISTCR
jgi:hypothetical protein